MGHEKGREVNISKKSIKEAINYLDNSLDNSLTYAEIKSDKVNKVNEKVIDLQISKNKKRKIIFREDKK